MLIIRVVQKLSKIFNVKYIWIYLFKFIGYDLRKIRLGRLANKKNAKPTLVLDMDKTLLYTKKKLNGILITYRPYLDEFLQEMSKLYNIVLFSHGRENYVHSLAEKIDPEGVIFQAIFSRSDCDYCANGAIPIKDLSKLNLNLKKTILVDDTRLCGLLQPYNLINIKAFMGNTNDIALLVLSKLLVKLIKCPDFTEYIKRKTN
ncbi:hypothetical protein A3Q56_07476 [Intoshia linei]|uniref:Mitochondrial import inner membrane translocase subunit TIM50 n=1 Tax=Intoshia linei TaxID=1819745 RepID=A0A177AS44_9BILA|nr:hypothetical protein A3Q56_07476 [Intoshia linei]